MDEEHSSCGAAPVIPLAAESDALAKLKSYASAEEFFAGLGLGYEPRVLQVARLHILKRMGEYLAGDDLEGLPNRVVIARCRGMLERAYQDFVQSSPLKERVFKVLKTAVAPDPGGFVPLDELH
ncbi:MAG: nitrogenase stabilizing/protective protein NifW [Hyphomicrobiaceae bacterium]|nr:nitrogenase stabilizing/protective protein NifW [Hyphomicrobiaceae bacterium]